MPNGFVLREPSTKFNDGWEGGKLLDDPIKDPHTAEYEALLAGLEFAKSKHVEYIAVFSDSQTLVSQLTRGWSARDHLEELRNRSRKVLDDDFQGWHVSWVPREWNKYADGLVDKELAKLEVPGDIERPD